MTDESSKPKKRELEPKDLQELYESHVRFNRDHPGTDTTYNGDYNTRGFAMDLAVRWMVGRVSTPTTDLIALADRIYRFMRFMPDQEPPKQ